MADLKYTLGKIKFGEGLNLEDTAKIKVMLVTMAYVGTATAADSMATVNAGEITPGGGYSAGGSLLAGNAVTDDGGANMKFDGTNLTWAASTITAGGAVLWDDDTVDTPIALFDFAGDKISSNGDFTINWNASGILTLS